MSSYQKNVYRIDEDYHLQGVYKIASILPTLTKTNKPQLQRSSSLLSSFSSLISSQRQQQQLPVNQPLQNPMTIEQFPKYEEEVLFDPTKEENEVVSSENIPIFKEVEKEEDVDEWRIDAIKEMLLKEYGESILKEDFTKNQQVGVMTIMRYARRNNTNYFNWFIFTFYSLKKQLQQILQINDSFIQHLNSENDEKFHLKEVFSF